MTATFPSSRPAKHLSHGTAGSAPSQVRVRDGVGAVDPRFGSIIEELDGDEQPTSWRADQPNELHASPIAVGALADEVGRLDCWLHELHDEIEPFRPAFLNMAKSVWRNKVVADYDSASSQCREP